VVLEKAVGIFKLCGGATARQQQQSRDTLPALQVNNTEIKLQENSLWDLQNCPSCALGLHRMPRQTKLHPNYTGGAYSVFKPPS